LKKAEEKRLSGQGFRIRRESRVTLATAIKAFCPLPFFVKLELSAVRSLEQVLLVCTRFLCGR
jgi:hypothetical protein